MQEGDESDSEKEPAGQVAQVDALVAPVEELAVPAVQAGTSEAKSETILHHMMIRILMRSEKVASTRCRVLFSRCSPSHVALLVAPVDVLYFPAAQSSHVASDVAPVDVLYFPAAQSSQVASDVAPVDVLYFPSPQSSHTAAPVAGLYFPSPQSWHAERRFEVAGL